MKEIKRLPRTKVLGTLTKGTSLSLFWTSPVWKMREKRNQLNSKSLQVRTESRLELSGKSGERFGLVGKGVCMRTENCCGCGIACLHIAFRHSSWLRGFQPSLFDKQFGIFENVRSPAKGWFLPVCKPRERLLHCTMESILGNWRRSTNNPQSDLGGVKESCSPRDQEPVKAPAHLACYGYLRFPQPAVVLFVYFMKY